MRVKIGNKWYNSDEQPICIQISEKEQALIGDMQRGPESNGMFAVFPEDTTMSAEQRLAWMKDVNEQADNNSIEKSIPSCAAVEALSGYQQADEEGIMVLVSRQAIEECLPILRILIG